MAASFERPVGCHADIKELEYLSALAQTGLPSLRKDASLHAKDIKYFLLSRHGIVVQTEQIKNEVLNDMACDFGDDEDDPDSVLDLCELVALLLIPHLRKIQESDKGKQDELFGRVLKLILEDVTGKAEMTEHVLDNGFMRQIIESYGELDASDALIEQMVHHASGGAAGDVVLNIDTFIRALTSDIEKYNPEFEERWSTHYEDVFGYQAPPSKIVTVGQGAGAVYTDPKTMEQSMVDGSPFKQRTVKHIYTAPALDHTADTYRSQTYTILLWIGLVVTYFAYVESFDLSANMNCNSEEFSCKIGNSIIQWILIFLQLSLLGTGYIFFGSAGNSVFNGNTIISLGSVMIGLVTVTMTCIVAFFYEVHTSFFDTTKYEGYYVAHYWSMIIGLCLISLQVVTMVRILLPTEKLLAMEARWIDRLLTPGLAKMECKTKRAAAFKTNNMVRNALEMHIPIHGAQSSGAVMSSYGRALLNFRTQEDVYERVGGFMWAWRKIFNGTIFTEEGIWLHSRLLIANFSQFFIATFMVSYLITFFYGQVFKDCEADPNDDALCPGEAPPTPPTWTPTTTPSLAPSTEAEWSNFTELFPGNPVANDFFNYLMYEKAVNVSLVFDIFVWLGFVDENGDPITRSPSAAPSVSNFTETPAADALVTNESTGLTLEEWEVRALVYSGAAGAFIAIIMVASMLLPSTITTILQFRCGIFGSLRDPEFKQYREAMELTTVVFGSCFFGAFYTGLFTFIVVGGFTLFCVWSETRQLAYTIGAQVIGVGVTIALKIVVLVLLRKKFYKAFYRKKPAAANIMNVIMEAWNIGLSLGYALARATKLIAITAIFLGRIDTPFLDKGIGFIGGVALDAYPYAFRKDLMLHEAHRHPYLERLGCIYMLKLYHGPEFASRAGSCWRLLFVVALMPWLRKYRVTHEFDDVDLDSDDEFEGDDAVDTLKSHRKSKPALDKPGAEDGLGSWRAAHPGLGDQHRFESSDVTRELILEKDNRDLLDVVKEEHDEVKSLKEKLMALEMQLSQSRALLAEEKEMRKAKDKAVVKLFKEIQKQRSALLDGSAIPSSASIL